MYVKERLWTVKRFNLRQIEMKTGQQVKTHVRKLLETSKTKAEDTFPTWHNILALYDSNAKLVNIVWSTLSFSVIHWLQSCSRHITFNVSQSFASLLLNHNKLTAYKQSMAVILITNQKLSPVQLVWKLSLKSPELSTAIADSSMLYTKWQWHYLVLLSMVGVADTLA